MDPNSLADELVKMYTDNQLDKKDVIRMVLPKVKDLDEFKNL